MKVEIPDDKLRKCRYCGKLFFPLSPRQEVCKDEACRKKRNNEKFRNYWNRKKGARK